jgi:probable HAF family extracellular repeat protein
MRKTAFAVAALGLMFGVGRTTDAEIIYQTNAALYGNNESDVVAGSIGGFAYLSNPNTVLGTFGGAGSQANAINNNGQIVGYAQTSTPTGYGGTLHAFLYSGGVMQDLGTFGGSESVATSINDSGSVVGYSDTTGGMEHAFLYSGGVMQDLGTLGGNSSIAYQINNLGQVVGSSIAADGQSHAFLYSGGVMQDLGVGVATAINNNGVVVGYESPGGSDPFIYSNGGKTVRNDGGIGFIPHAINDDGLVVGASSSTSIGTSAQAFLYTNDTGFVKLADLLPPGSFGSNGFSLATDINDHGHIVGIDNFGGFEVSINPNDPITNVPYLNTVPEPSTLLGAATGVLMLAGYAWRRRRKARVATA